MKKETLAKAKELEEDIRLVKDATTYFRTQRWSHWDLNDRADTFHFDFCKNYSGKSHDCVHLPRWMNGKLIQVLYQELNRMEQELEALGDADTGGATQKENEMPQGEWQPVKDHKEGDRVVRDGVWYECIGDKLKPVTPKDKSGEDAAIRTINRLISWMIYSATFCFLFGVAGLELSAREIIAYSLMLGLVAGSINNIERVMRELFEKKED